ncbi:MAG: hypothetical protein M3348_13285 [Acidobacteriota bacterium]|nr:hypothetical protein [Acidobacteriota bacterium]
MNKTRKKQAQRRIPPIYINNPGAARKSRLRLAAQLLERGMSDITCAAIDEHLDRLAESYPQLQRDHFHPDRAAA